MTAVSDLDPAHLNMVNALIDRLNAYVGQEHALEQEHAVALAASAAIAAAAALSGLKLSRSETQVKSGDLEMVVDQFRVRLLGFMQTNCPSALLPALRGGHM